MLALAVVLAIGAPRTSDAQTPCVTEFQNSDGDAIVETICQEAVGKKCSFPISLCVNQPGEGEDTCTAATLKPKKVRAKGNCGPVGRVQVKPNGTEAVCGAIASLPLRTKRNGQRERSCPIKAGGKGTPTARITLRCVPQGSGLCPTTTTTTNPASSTTTTTVSSTTTTTFPPGTCCGFNDPGPGRLSFTTVVGQGSCGTVQLSNGTVSKNLACSGLYTGGGGNTVPLPYNVPDMGNTLTAVSQCNAGTAELTLANLTSAETGGNRNCSSVGCLFGAPLPIPNSGSTPTSVCVVNVVATNASGTANCNTGVSNINLPLSSVLYLSGDLFPNAPGIQVCPTCNQTCTGGTNNGGPCNGSGDCTGGGTCGGSNVCHGGENAGDPCTPEDSAQGATNSFPTSHDCQPTSTHNIGALPIAFNLTTGSTSKTAVNNTASGQNNVFCGYCRDLNNLGTGCFQGDPNVACPVPGGSAVACTSNADCNSNYPDCVQRSGGAFGPAGGGARTITEMGSPAGSLTDGAAHASTLASIFCIQPTFNATVDAAGDLPGPGAVTLSGVAQLLP